MKPVLAFFLGLLMLTSSLIPQNDLAELGKLPRLLEHYRFHHSVAGGSLSLGQFLALHYGAATAHYQHPHSASHDQDHHNLPLRCHHDCTLVAFVLPAVRVVVLAGQRLSWPTPAYRVASRPLYAFSFSMSLLQPPRA
ncbi:hypothetical protein [Hymenobacter psychrotolerans]|uniref:Uncharacterized protein n=1 Tax=Hymenobacter psychrotolerans DSM 18569 TaxID=1121959 RepID=A0A1M7GPK2_9BACT|nr:hypothetical protein [Hymenobacter psychrotolerans]SHM18095.1 hypothetical protein SAMN02746009_04076 [Hymenobacter psychrotolerans DSM 18569]